MPAPATAERPATYRDVLDAPPHMVAEVLAGTLHTHPRPVSRHARAGTGGPAIRRGSGGTDRHTCPAAAFGE